MSKIYVEINQTVNFNIEIYKDPVSQIFFQQHQTVGQTDPTRSVASIVDASKYTINYFINQINQAKAIGAIDWSKYKIQAGMEYYHDNQRQFNEMHKDLEVVAGIQQYAGLNDEQKQLLDDMHCCLHSLEKDSAPLDYHFDSRSYILFNYYVDYARTLMPEPVKFKRSIEPGEVMLDYGYVGKEPIYCMIHNDNSILQQTCRMIDRISLSWKLHLNDQPGTQWGPDPWPKDVDAELTAWYYENKNDMDALDYSLEKILNHTGFYTVGRIDNLSVLKYLRDTPNIQVTDYQLLI
jgi:hypothetical protein